MKLLIVVSTLLLIVNVTAQTVAPLTNFQPERAVGIWYVVARSAQANPQLRCPIVNWTLSLPEGVNFSFTALDRSTGAPIVSDLFFHFVGGANTGVFNVTSGDQLVGSRQVIAIDYSCYQIIYGHNIAQNVDVLFLLTRRRRLRRRLLRNAQNIVNSRGINLTFELFDENCTN